MFHASTRRAMLLQASAAFLVGALLQLPWASQSLAADAPIAAARFALTVDGYATASFTKLTSLDATSIVLTGPRGSNLSMWAWHEAARTGLSARRNARLVMYNSAGEPVARYHLESAWPAKIESPRLTSGSSEVALETLTLVVERLTRV